MDKVYVVKENDLIVNITFAWEHAIAVATKEDDGLVVSHRFPTYRTNERADIEFIKHIISKRDFKLQLEFISPGGAGRNRVMNKKDFLKINIKIPNSILEQQKIGRFFSLLDRRIALHQRKLENLKKLKKALLQQMLV